jgi:hypothetical protein
MFPFGVAEIAPAAASCSVALNLGHLLHAAGHKLLTRRRKVGDGVPNLVTGLVVLRFGAALDELEHARVAEAEPDPARPGGHFGQPSTSRWKRRCASISSATTPAQQGQPRFIATLPPRFAVAPQGRHSHSRTSKP